MKKINIFVFLIVIFIGTYLCSNIVVINYGIYFLSDFYTEKEYKALLRSVLTNKITDLEKHIGSNIDINKIGNKEITPLYFAAATRKYESFKYLLKRGADPDYVPKHRPEILFYCLELEDSRYLEEAIRHGANLNIDYTDRRRLINGSLFSSVPLKNFEILLKNKIDVNYSFEDAQNPLLTALTFREYKRAILLFEYGAKLDDNEKFTLYRGDITQKQLFIERLESENYGHFEGTIKLKEQQEFVKYLKEKLNIEIKLKYPNGAPRRPVKKVGWK